MRRRAVSGSGPDAPYLLFPRKHADAAPAEPRTGERPGLYQHTCDRQYQRGYPVERRADRLPVSAARRTADYFYEPDRFGRNVPQPD